MSKLEHTLKVLGEVVRVLKEKPAAHTFKMTTWLRTHTDGTTEGCTIGLCMRDKWFNALGLGARTWSGTASYTSSNPTFQTLNNCEAVRAMLGLPLLWEGNAGLDQYLFYGQSYAGTEEGDGVVGLNVTLGQVLSRILYIIQVLERGQPLTDEDIGQVLFKPTHTEYDRVEQKIMDAYPSVFKRTILDLNLLMGFR